MGAAPFAAAKRGKRDDAIAGLFFGPLPKDLEDSARAVVEKLAEGEALAGVVPHAAKEHEAHARDRISPQDISLPEQQHMADTDERQRREPPEVCREHAAPTCLGALELQREPQTEQKGQERHGLSVDEDVEQGEEHFVGPVGLRDDLRARHERAPAEPWHGVGEELTYRLFLCVGPAVLPSRVATYNLPPGALGLLDPCLPYEGDTAYLFYRADLHRTRAALRVKDALVRRGLELNEAVELPCGVPRVGAPVRSRVEPRVAKGRGAKR